MQHCCQLTPPVGQVREKFVGLPPSFAICQLRCSIAPCVGSKVCRDITLAVMSCGRRYTLCDVVCGEDILIPHQLMLHSIAHYQPDSHLLSELVQTKSSQDGVTAPAGVSSKVDVIVDLVASILLLCEVEGLYLECSHIELVSPQLSETTVWCLSCVVGPYLMINEESYNQVSQALGTIPSSSPPLPPSRSLSLDHSLSPSSTMCPLFPQISLSLLSVFGQDSQSASWMVSFLLDKVRSFTAHLLPLFILPSLPPPRCSRTSITGRGRSRWC